MPDRATNTNTIDETQMDTRITSPTVTAAAASKFDSKGRAFPDTFNSREEFIQHYRRVPTFDWELRSIKPITDEQSRKSHYDSTKGNPSAWTPDVDLSKYGNWQPDFSAASWEREYPTGSSNP
ncbi:hypothetical protein TREMEDRAFT_61337 [Tremella mesenterica DSM 1558]|uniref:uncharacterized protein n=1 Tax=Tremella mesenterica (strain ATCC 24925 / CBS 8224 / DSM 1558 / NBRC 9311 / NRRL Y-6157 / RJB 2259-6 / UBC 559-6) TaxID=578456 RepID=UPI0003F49434|nr:uncharacterized protein TREMEDRAFT_61337 [Tremella mesenterica DSM 1558]EIW70831.1 hypothetical protein TREMEDRAFT_61337 [Tremella mesenterica DSM 1558]